MWLLEVKRKIELSLIHLRIASWADALSAGERVLTGLVVEVLAELEPQSMDFSLGGLSMDSGDGILSFMVIVL